MQPNSVKTNKNAKGPFETKLAKNVRVSIYTYGRSKVKIDPY